MVLDFTDFYDIPSQEKDGYGMRSVKRLHTLGCAEVCKKVAAPIIIKCRWPLLFFSCVNFLLHFSIYYVVCTMYLNLDRDRRKLFGRSVANFFN